LNRTYKSFENLISSYWTSNTYICMLAKAIKQSHCV